MKNLIIFFLLIFTSCSGIKKSIKKDIEIEKDNTVIVAKRNGIADLITINDIISKQFEIIRYEPVYYIKEGKDTVEIKPTIYRKLEIENKSEEFVKIDTTLSVNKNNNVVDIKDKSEEDKVVEKSKGFNYFLYGIIVGLLIMLSIPLIRFIKKLPIKLF